MSDILIKGMKMPTNCNNCWALDDYGDYPRCRITEEQRGYKFPIREKRMGNCPLVPVPPHGRLIDADALLNLLNNCMFPSDMVTTMAVRMATNWIKEAPTILEAEGGE